MLTLSKAFDLAVRNVSRWGDTDVFPFAPENHVLHDQRSDVVNALTALNKEFPAELIRNPPAIEGAQSLVTYEGFLWVTQLDPLWNAYFLGLVLSIAEEIEAERLPVSRNIVCGHSRHRGFLQSHLPPSP